jgi:hypothetical protein
VQQDIAHRPSAKTAAYKSRFIMLSKKARGLVRRAKLEYTNQLLNPKLPSKVLWRNLDGMGVRDSGGSDVIFSSQELSNSYSSLGEDNAPMARSHGEPSATPAGCDHGDAICGIKSGAVGLDGNSIRFLRLILPSILPCVTHIFNTVLTYSIFPEAWKMSKILPISKIPYPGELRDFRQISVLP